jgi:hypothetical protein
MSIYWQNLSTLHKMYGNDSYSRGCMREPKIMKMDWRPLGYWPVYKDGKLTWEKDPDVQDE